MSNALAKDERVEIRGAYPFDLPSSIYYIIHYHIIHTTKSLTHKGLQMAKKHDKGLKNIGERIKYIRGALTQPEFGKKLGVGRNNVYTWETNKNMPLAETLLRIYKEYGVNINWLLSGEGEPYINKSKRSIVVGSRYLKIETRLSALERRVSKLAK